MLAAPYKKVMQSLEERHLAKKFLECGKFVTTHGIKGELKLEPWVDSPDELSPVKTLYLKNGETELLVKCRPQKNMVIVKIKDVETIEDALKYRGKIVYINPEDIKTAPGEYFVQDIIGLEVVDFADPQTVYGRVDDVLKTGANDVYSVKTADGKNVYIPVIPDVVNEVDLAAEVIKITPLRGLFDD